ncbi:MAG: single-stranded-DNA-specific exonuclease RecJ [Lachnospiraceae bacterium]|nr:single-stranded-DNA-specific exonuclease RecJ [Lachnospiraceae bacterium]
MEKWVISAKKEVFRAISEKFGIDPVIARIIRNRDIVGDDAIDEFLNGSIADLHDPMLFKDMDKAVRVLKKKITEKKRIRVIGDYDIDGIMSSFILKTGFAELGADVDIKIPDRITDGYGINANLIRQAAEDGIDTIVTCDNGISAGEQIRIAKELGLTVVVTDHHEVLTIPDAADAVVDPKQKDCPYPFKELCGAAVAWKLILAMGGDREKKLLQFAAFATVGDVVDLTGENRILVKEGLKQLRRTENPGLRALAEACGIDITTLDAYRIGFVLGPCMNASGRLDTALRACSLLEATQGAEAAKLARELKELNDSRKALTEKGVEDALAYVTDNDVLNDKVYVIYLPELHESLAGIVAGRVREKYNHPTFVLTKSEDGVKGSGRSIETYRMFDGLVGVAHLLKKFGGHPMAAGLTLSPENVEVFRKEINEQCTLEKEEFVQKIVIDVPMPIGYVTEDLVTEMDILAPYGKANPRPVFAQKGVVFSNVRILGANRNVLKARLSVPGDRMYGGVSVDGIAFRRVDELMERIGTGEPLSIVYYPQINEYMGRRTIQIVINSFL